MLHVLVAVDSTVLNCVVEQEDRQCQNRACCARCGCACTEAAPVVLINHATNLNARAKRVCFVGGVEFLVVLMQRLARHCGREQRKAVHRLCVWLASALLWGWPRPDVQTNH